MGLIFEILSGVFHLPWWSYVVITLVLTHITIVSVTIFLHRSQAHPAVQLSGFIKHCFRFWLWITTAIITKEWTSTHRKHHAKCETSEDPHSPRIRGIKKVLLEGYELYAKEAANEETLRRYGKGTPNDWIELNLYSRFPNLGIIIMLVVNVVLFGPIGITMWAVQMVWIPIMAAGVINGVGHYWGYRNKETPDASKNVLPWGILIGGEELHNNHHAYPVSAKLSLKWYEFDIGWFYIRILETIGLAHVRYIHDKKVG